MARPSAKAAPGKTGPAKVVAPARAGAAKATGSRVSPARAVPPKAPPARPAPPLRRATYVDAVAAYEKGVAALQKHNYRGALGLFEGILTSFPEERELHEQIGRAHV